MKTLRFQIYLIPFLLVALATLGGVHFSARHDLARVDLIRLEYEREIEKLRKSLREKDIKIKEMEVEERRLREELGIRIHESNIFPDGQFLAEVAERLRGSGGLSPDTELGRIYLERAVLLEKHEVSSFFHRPEATVIKFPESSRVARAVFPVGGPQYEQVAAMKQRNRYMISFVGRIDGWDGRFSLKDCRVSALWEFPR